MILWLGPFSSLTSIGLPSSGKVCKTCSVEEKSLRRDCFYSEARPESSSSRLMALKEKACLGSAFL